MKLMLCIFLKYKNFQKYTYIILHLQKYIVKGTLQNYKLRNIYTKLLHIHYQH